MKKQFNLITLFISLISFQIFASSDVDTTTQKLLDIEARDYIEALESSEGEALFAIALELQDSGVTDKRVLDVAKTVALEHHRSYNAGRGGKIAHDVAASLARFLAGSGTEDYFPTLNHFVETSRSRRLRNLSKTLMTRIEWYKARNEVMNEFSQHDSEHSILITRYINLLENNDRTLGRYVAESMKRQERNDQPLTDRMAKIVKEHYRDPGVADDLDTIAWYLRTLGRQGEVYRPLLEEVSNYDSLHTKLRRHINKALRGV